MGFGTESGGTSTIGGASDVSLNNPANSQGLQFNSTTAKWQNGPIPSRLQENINVVAASGATQTLPDVTVATIHDVTLTADCSFTFPAATSGKSFSVRVTYTSASFDITWPGIVDWPNGINPTLTKVIGKKDIFSFVCFSDGRWVGFTAGLNY